MRRILAVMFVLSCSAIAQAGPLIDFSGVGGDLGIVKTTIGGIEINAIGGTLYQRSDPGDHGMGVCGPDQDCTIGDRNELDANEWIILKRPDGYRWTGLWISSLDGNEAGYYILGGYPVGGERFAAGEGAFASGVEGLIPLDSLQPYIWIHPDYRICDRDFLVWGVDLAPVETVPEPASLLLLGTGLLLAVRRKMES